MALLQLNVFFDDGLLPLSFEIPEGIDQEELRIWAHGIGTGVNGYMNATHQSRNFNEPEEFEHKHKMKCAGTSRRDRVLFFVCDICGAGRAYTRGDIRRMLTKGARYKHRMRKS